MSVQSREGTIMSFVVDCWREMTAVGDELQLWLNGMSDDQQESELGDEISAAINDIEAGPYEPDVPLAIQGVSLDCNLDIYAQMSRATRRDNCLKMLIAVIDKCDQLKQEMKEPNPLLASFVDAVQKAKDQWANLTFPTSG